MTSRSTTRISEVDAYILTIVHRCLACAGVQSSVTMWTTVGVSGMSSAINSGLCLKCIAFCIAWQLMGKSSASTVKRTSIISHLLLLWRQRRRSSVSSHDVHLFSGFGDVLFCELRCLHEIGRRIREHRGVFRLITQKVSA